jgi:hypothetical protein
MTRSMSMAAALLIGLTLTLAACNGPDTEAAFTFDELRIEELAPTRAVVRFKTSGPASCQIVYGVDATALDLTATDPSMAEGQLSEEHEVSLEDLLADSVYTWFARATDADGTVHPSERQTFHTPPAATMQLQTNVALATANTTIAGKSSNWGNGPDDGPFGALNAIDDKMATEWSSNGDGDDAWLELDLGQPRDLVAFGFRSRMMTDGTSIVTSVEVLLDGSTRLGPFATPDHTRLYHFDFAEPQQATRVRLQILSSTGGNTGVREMQLFTAP